MCENNLLDYVEKLSNKNIKLHSKKLNVLFNIQMLVQNNIYGHLYMQCN